MNKDRVEFVENLLSDRYEETNKKIQPVRKELEELTLTIVGLIHKWAPVQFWFINLGATIWLFLIDVNNILPDFQWDAIKTKEFLRNLMMIKRENRNYLRSGEHLLHVLRQALRLTAKEIPLEPPYGEKYNERIRINEEEKPTRKEMKQIEKEIIRPWELINDTDLLRHDMHMNEYKSRPKVPLRDRRTSEEIEADEQYTKLWQRRIKSPEYSEDDYDLDSTGSEEEN